MPQLNMIYEILLISNFQHIIIVFIESLVPELSMHRRQVQDMPNVYVLLVTGNTATSK